MTEKLIRAYFDQDVQYFSEGSEELQIISEMHPVHARNAADKLLREAKHWAAETNFRGPVSDFYWLITTPLFRALVAQAGEQ